MNSFNTNTNEIIQNTKKRKFKQNKYNVDDVTSNTSQNKLRKIHHNYRNNKIKFEKISFGIILIDNNSKKPRILLIQRKDSFGFIDCIRNNGNINQIMKSFNTLTNEEVYKLKNLPFDILVQQACNTKPHQKLINKWKKNFKNTNIRNLVHNILHLQEEHDWEIPKGKKLKKETPINCALRELYEETGFNKYNINIQNNIEFVETYIGTNDKLYKNVFFLGILKNHIKINWTTQERITGETLKIKFIDINDVNKEWKEYQKSKIKIINSVKKWIEKNL